MEIYHVPKSLAKLRQHEWKAWKTLGNPNRKPESGAGLNREWYGELSFSATSWAESLQSCCWCTLNLSHKTSIRLGCDILKPTINHTNMPFCHGFYCWLPVDCQSHIAFGSTWASTHTTFAIETSRPNPPINTPWAWMAWSLPTGDKKPLGKA